MKDSRREGRRQELSESADEFEFGFKFRVVLAVLVEEEGM
jgi:hypothetical protein